MIRSLLPGCSAVLKSAMATEPKRLSSTLPASDAIITKILKNTKVVAMVGASPTSTRPSYHVMEYLQSKGYRVVPVNPVAAEKGEVILNEPVYSTLSDIPVDIRGSIDIVDIFRKPSDVSDIVDEAIFIGAKTVWMQLGVAHADAAMRAEASGLDVVMDRCLKMEHERLTESGELQVSQPLPLL